LDLNNSAAGTPAAQPAPTGAVGSSTGEPIGAPTPPVAAPASPAGAQTAPAGGEPTKPPPKGPTRVTLTTAELNERMRRANAAKLKELFGTDDVEAIKAARAKADELERKAEEAERARMTAEQRLQHDLAKARANEARYRVQLSQVQQRQVMREQTDVVVGIASKFVHPEAINEAKVAFALHIDSLDPKVVARMGPANISNWFKQYVTKKPFMARPADAPAAPPARTVTRQPAGSPTPPPRPARPAGPSTTEGKTFRPGQPNSMTAQEAREERRRLGYTY